MGDLRGQQTLGNSLELLVNLGGILATNLLQVLLPQVDILYCPLLVNYL